MKKAHEQYSWTFTQMQLGDRQTENHFTYAHRSMWHMSTKSHISLRWRQALNQQETTYFHDMFVHFICFAPTHHVGGLTRPAFTVTHSDWWDKYLSDTPNHISEVTDHEHS